MTDEDDEATSAFDFTAVDCRVLGSLIEKDKATPQNYPLTLNALRLACNQSSNRDPIMDLDEHTIDETLASLRDRHLTRIVYSTSNRAAKYRHVLDERLRVDDRGLAVLCVLMLRGPQTLGEIKTRTERLHRFTDLGDVQAAIDELATHPEGPLVVRLERRPGQKDARYAHLLSGPVRELPFTGPAAGYDASASGVRPDPDQADLRAELDDLREQLSALRAEFDQFRSAFGE